MEMCECCCVFSCVSSAIALGWSAMLGCGVCEGGVVEVRPITRPVSKIPVAGEVVLAAT